MPSLNRVETLESLRSVLCKTIKTEWEIAVRIKNIPLEDQAIFVRELRSCIDELSNYLRGVERALKP